MEYIATPLRRTMSIKSVVSIHYYEYTNDFSYPGESHDFWEIIYCDKGSLKIYAGNKIYTLSRGQAYLHPPKQYHNVKTAGEESANSIIFSFFSDCEELYSISDKIIDLDDFAISSMFSIIRESKASFQNPLGVLSDPQLKRKQKPDAYAAEQVIQNSMELFFIHIIRKITFNSKEPTVPREERSDLLAKRISNYMREHISDKLTFSDIALTFSVSPTTLKKIFKKRFGCGAMEHFTNLKIEYSKELLRNGNYSCTEIASICGFCSIHHFSRVFKEKIGMSPTEYIKTVKSLLDANQIQN